MANQDKYIRVLEDLGSEDTPTVGGKNSSLGEMISSLKEEGINVPGGFATTSHTYWKFLEANEMNEAISAGKVQIINSADDIDQFEEDSILITGMTDPDWVPIMKKASGIITDHGGRTSHAAIVSRELGIPAVVRTGEATSELQDGQEVTLYCAEGNRGYVYKGILDFQESELNLRDIPETKTQIMMNIAIPAAAFRWWGLPASGIGLARMEFIINNIIKIHPLALIRYDELKDKKARRQIRKLTQGYEDKKEYFIDHLARGIDSISLNPDSIIDVKKRLAEMKKS